LHLVTAHKRIRDGVDAGVRFTPRDLRQHIGHVFFFRDDIGRDAAESVTAARATLSGNGQAMLTA
jgi:hypothetical protein